MDEATETTSPDASAAEDISTGGTSDVFEGDGATAGGNLATDLDGLGPEDLDGLGPEDLDALASARESNDGDSSDAGTEGNEMVEIGGVEVPVSALAEYLSGADDLLGKVKRKVKANGKEREVSLLDALGAVPKAEGFERKMWEASQRQQELEQIAQRLQGDPVGALVALGHPREKAIDIVAGQLAQELEIDAMTPEQRAKHEEEQELRRKAQRLEEIEKQQQQQVREQRVAQMRETYLKGMRSSLEAAGIPVSPYALGRMGLIIEAGVRDQTIPATPAEADYRWAAEQVAREHAAERDTWLPDDLDGDALIKRLGETKARKVARAFAQRIRAAQQSPRRDPGAGGQRTPRRQEQQAPKTWEEWQEDADRRMGIRR